MTTRADALANTADGTDSIGDRKAENVVFSRGPWRVHPTDNTGVVDAYGGDVAAVTGDYAEEWVVMEANARLIASAPAMFEALERAVAEMAGITQHTICDMEWSTFEAMRAALSLARGEKK